MFRLPRPALILAAVAFALVVLSCLHALTVAFDVQADRSPDVDRSLYADLGGLILGVALAVWSFVQLHREHEPSAQAPATGRDPAEFLDREPEDRVRPRVLSRGAA